MATSLEELDALMAIWDAEDAKFQKTIRYRYWLKYYYPTLRFAKEWKGYRNRLTQRYRYGISRSDSWDLMSFLANAIWRGTDQILEQGYGEHPQELYLIRAGFDVWVNVDEDGWTDNRRLLMKDAQKALGEHFNELWD
jgi:hypothetical protein